MNDPINNESFNFTEQREAQLTAYALGELDEHERALLERRLEHDAEARAIVAQVRELATTLTAKLAAEPMPRLSEPQREALRVEHPTRVSGDSRPKARAVPLRTRLWFGAGLAAAACLAIAVTTFDLSDSANEPRVRFSERLALGLPADEVQGRVDDRGQHAGQSDSRELYTFGKQANNEPTDLKRQAGRELKLDAANKLAAAGPSANARPARGAPAGEVYRAPMQAMPSADAGLESQSMPAASSVQLGQELAMRNSKEQVLRQPLDHLAAEQAPSVPREALSDLARPAVVYPPAESPSMWPVDKEKKDAERALSVTGATISPVGERGSVALGGGVGGGGGGDGKPTSGFRLSVGSHAPDRILADIEGDAGHLPWSRNSEVDDLDDSRFRSGVSLAASDINERIAAARTDLGIIDHVLADRSRAINQGAPLTQDERLEAELQAEITRRRNEIDGLRAQLHEADRGSAAGSGAAQQAAARLADAERAYQQSVLACVKQRRAEEVRELETRRSTILQLIQELDVERERCEALRRQQPNTETYNRIVDNPFLAVTDNPLSTFSIDVDTGSYANVRRFLLQNNTLPPPDAVRIEELINYFPLTAAAPGPESEHPFAVYVDMWEAPWSGDHHLARVTIKGREVKMDQRPATSLVFLIDVSGSMQPADKLPLLKQSMKMLVDQLNGDDRIGIVTYAGASGLALPSTFASDKQLILAAIDNLNAGGSTNGAAGIQLAYQVATESFIPGGVNRVILATDGDFNVGVSDDASLIRLIEEKRTTGVHLSVLGFGEGNLKDAKMEQLANHGNGEYAYIDSAREGRKILVEQAAGTLITIAKDVKIQIEFNPATVASYRLIGYENRVLAKEDFNNDAKDAGEIGAGHCVTALYEIVSANADVAGVAPVDALKYQKPAVQPTDAAKNSGELMTIKLRYKQPDGQVSKLIEMPVPDMRGRLGWVPDDMRFLTAVAEFGMLLRNSPYKGNASFAQVLDLAEGSRGEDAGGYRAEFIELVNRAKALRGQ